MFASIRKYECIADVSEITLAVKEQLFPLFEKQAGFVSYTLVDTGAQSVMSLTIFETREQSDAAVRDLVQELLSHVIPNPALVVVAEVLAHLGQ